MIRIVIILDYEDSLRLFKANGAYLFSNQSRDSKLSFLFLSKSTTKCSKLCVTPSLPDLKVRQNLLKRASLPTLVRTSQDPEEKAARMIAKKMMMARINRLSGSHQELDICFRAPPGLPVPLRGRTNLFEVLRVFVSDSVQLRVMRIMRAFTASLSLRRGL